MQSTISASNNVPAVYFSSLIFTDDSITKSLGSQEKNNKYILRIIQKENRLACHDFYFCQQNLSRKSTAYKFSLNIKVPQNAGTIYLCQVVKNSKGQSNETKIAKGSIDLNKIIQKQRQNSKKVSLYLYGIKKQKKDQTIAMIAYNLQYDDQILQNSLSNSQQSSFIQNKNKQRKLNYKFVYERQKMTEMSKQQSIYQANAHFKKSLNSSNLFQSSIIQNLNKNQLQKSHNKNTFNNSFSMNDRYEESQVGSEPKVKIHFPEQKEPSQRKIVNNLIFFKFQGKKIDKKDVQLHKKPRITSQLTDYSIVSQKKNKLSKFIAYNSSIIPSPRDLLKTKEKEKFVNYSNSSVEPQKTINILKQPGHIISNRVTRGKFSFRNATSQRKNEFHQAQSQKIVPVTLSLSKSQLKSNNSLNRSYNIIQSPIHKRYQNRFSAGQISPRLKQIIQKNEDSQNKNYLLFKIKRIAIYLNSLQESDYYSHYDSWLFQDTFSYFVEIISQKNFYKFKAILTQDVQTDKQMLLVDQEIVFRDYQSTSTKKIVINIVKQNKVNELSEQKSRIIQNKIAMSAFNFNELEYSQNNQQKNSNLRSEQSSSQIQKNIEQIYFQKHLLQDGHQAGKYQVFYQIQKLENSITSKKKLQWKTILFSNSDLNPQKNEQEKLPPINSKSFSIKIPNKFNQKFKKKNSKFRETIINIK